MSATDTTTAPEPTAPGVAWLAACALGLASSPVRGDRRVQMLGDAARWDAGLLQAAHRTVSAADVADPIVRSGAAALLRDAFARSRRRAAAPARRSGWTAR